MSSCFYLWGIASRLFSSRIFPPLVQSAFSPASWICNKIILPLSLSGFSGARKCPKTRGEVYKGVPYETALQRLQLFSLVRRRIRFDLICMHKIMHDLLDFPCDAVFVATRIGLRGHTFKVHQQRCKTRRRQNALSVRVVPYWNKPPEEIVTATFVETFKFRVDARWQSIFPEVPI